MRPPRGAGHALAVGDAVDEVLPLRRACLQGGSRDWGWVGGWGWGWGWGWAQARARARA